MRNLTQNFCFRLDDLNRDKKAFKFRRLFNSEFLQQGME